MQRQERVCVCVCLGTESEREPGLYAVTAEVEWWDVRLSYCRDEITSLLSALLLLSHHFSRDDRWEHNEKKNHRHLFGAVKYSQLMKSGRVQVTMFLRLLVEAATCFWIGKTSNKIFTVSILSIVIKCKPQKWKGEKTEINVAFTIFKNSKQKQLQ